MDEIIILICCLVIISTIFYLLGYLKYKKAMKSSTNHIERALIFSELVQLKVEYDNAKKRGAFVDAPEIKEYLDLMNIIFVDNGIEQIPLIKFKLDKLDSPYIDELKKNSKNGDVYDFMSRYSLAFNNIFRINQPVKYMLTVASLKKIEPVRILYHLTESLIFLFKSIFSKLKTLFQKTKPKAYQDDAIDIVSMFFISENGQNNLKGLS